MADSKRQDDEAAGVSRRRYLASGLAAVAVGTAGCVTTGLRIESEGVESSDVFDSISLSESWTASNATVTVNLTERAAKQGNVRKVSVVSASGSSVWAGTVDPGQTSISNALLPVGETATLVAVNGSDEYIDDISVRIVGSSIP